MLASDLIFEDENDDEDEKDKLIPQNPIQCPPRARNG